MKYRLPPTKNQRAYNKAKKQGDALWKVYYDLEQQAKQMPAKVAEAKKAFEATVIPRAFLSLQFECEEYWKSANKIYFLHWNLNIFPDERLTQEQKELRDHLNRTFGDCESPNHTMIANECRDIILGGDKGTQNFKRLLAEYKWPETTKKAA